METLVENKEVLSFSCAPTQYFSKADNSGIIGGIGCVGYTGLRYGKNEIPKSILLTIQLKEFNKEKIEKIYEQLLPEITDDCLININRYYDQYQEVVDKYEKQLDCEKCEYAKKVDKFKFLYEQLVSDNFEDITIREFQKSRELFRLKDEIIRYTPCINIHCKEGTKIYAQILENRFLDPKEYEY